MYSSFSSVASRCACWNTRPRRALAASCTLPCTFGRRVSSVSSADASCAGCTPREFSTLGTMPPDCCTSASARCSTSIWLWPLSRAEFCAARTASCVFSVILLGSIISISAFSRRHALHLEQMPPWIFLAFADPADGVFVLVGQLRRQHDLHRHVQIAESTAGARHALPREADGPSVLRLRRDAERDAALQRWHRDLGAEQRFVQRHRQVQAQVVRGTAGQRMGPEPPGQGESGRRGA